MKINGRIHVPGGVATEASYYDTSLPMYVLEGDNLASMNQGTDPTLKDKFRNARIKVSDKIKSFYKKLVSFFESHKKEIEESTNPAEEGFFGFKSKGPSTTKLDVDSAMDWMIANANDLAKTYDVKSGRIVKSDPDNYIDQFVREIFLVIKQDYLWQEELPLMSFSVKSKNTVNRNIPMLCMMGVNWANMANSVASCGYAVVITDRPFEQIVVSDSERGWKWNPKNMKDFEITVFYHSIYDLADQVTRDPAGKNTTACCVGTLTMGAPDDSDPI